jgi:hypothetical protein
MGGGVCGRILCGVCWVHWQVDYGGQKLCSTAQPPYIWGFNQSNGGLDCPDQPSRMAGWGIGVRGLLLCMYRSSPLHLANIMNRYLNSDTAIAPLDTQSCQATEK